MDRFTKIVKIIPTNGVSTDEVAKLLVNNWVFNYGPPTELLLSENGYQFTFKFMEVYRIPPTNNVFTTTYNTQINGQSEQFNRTILACDTWVILDVRSNTVTDWDMYTPALTYPYKAQPQSSTSVALLELILSRPLGQISANVPQKSISTPIQFKEK